MKIRITIISAILLLLSFSTGAQQLYNMSFDKWSKDGGCWNPFDEGADNPTWDTANHGLSLFGINGAVPEYNHLAVKGPGKAAVKLETKQLLGIFISGNIYTGKFLNIVKMKGARLSMGVPFHGRPKSLSGYIHYIPGTINVTSKELKYLKGRTDIAKVDITLKNGGKPDIIDSTDKDFKEQEDKYAPDVVAYGVAYFTEATDGYIYFEIPIEYRNDNIPTHVTIAACGSKWSQQFTGSTDSVVYLDELQFNY